jgi:hypothetical protein
MANYYYFKPRSGKWKYDGEGASIPADGAPLTHDRIADLNGGSMPGITSDGKDYIVVVIDEESFPRLVFAENVDG